MSWVSGHFEKVNISNRIFFKEKQRNAISVFPHALCVSLVIAFHLNNLFSKRNFPSCLLFNDKYYF